MPQTIPRKPYVLLPFLLFAAIAAAYGNSLFGPWVLDDIPNILENQPLHPAELSFQSLIHTFYAYPDIPGKLFRPLSCLSFGLNWYWGQDNVFGYHLVNICIHMLAAFFLYLSCIQLLNTPEFPGRYSHNSKYFIALTAALLWSLNPIQTQAVTYIVQRMALLAALFSIIGIYFFLKARLASSRKATILNTIFCVLSFFCALASKENAIIFPISLLLIEFIYFKSYKVLLQFTPKLKWLYFNLALGTIGAFFLLGLRYLAPYLDYSNRTFTLYERLLTEPGILLFYLSQLFFPATSRLSLEHDVVLSTSPFSPISTFAAILICLSLIGISLRFSRNYPLFSFAILFFFLNHVVESTIIPLELLFEHRNYLPSLFLFLPLSAFFIAIAKKGNTRTIRILSPLIPAILIVTFGFNTSARNNAWATGLALWSDAHSKAPQNNRAATNLAKEYISMHRLDEALALLQKAYFLPQPTKNYAEALSLNGQGVILDLQGNTLKAEEYFRKSLEFVPDYSHARRGRILSLIKLDRLEDALAVFQPTDSMPIFHDTPLQGLILLKLNRPKEALHLFRSVGRKEILSVKITQGIGKALSMLGHHQQADFFLRQAAKFSLSGAMCQIENFILAGEEELSQRTTKKMISTFPAYIILNYFNGFDPFNLPLDKQTLYPIVMQQAREIFQNENQE